MKGGVVICVICVYKLLIWMSVFGFLSWDYFKWVGKYIRHEYFCIFNESPLLIKGRVGNGIR